MGVFESYQQRSFRLALEILRLYRKLLANPDIPRHVASQVCRAGTAIGANLEEARSAYSRRDLAAKYSIALRESRECHYWLRLLKADQPELTKVADPLIEEVHQLIAMLTAAVIKLRRAKPTSDTTSAP
jgi:four helix bundle protein